MSRRRRQSTPRSTKGFATSVPKTPPPPPVDSSALLQQAIQLVQAKRWAHAEDLCLQILADQPLNADALNLLGLLYRQVGDRNKAKRWLQRAIEADPNYVEAHSNLATVLREQELWQEALEQFDQALQINPDHVLTLYNLGLLHQQQHRLPEAMECYQKVIQLQPQMADAHNNLGTVLRALGRPQAAAECFRQALFLREDPHTLTNLGNALKKMGDLQRAKEAYQMALSWDPGYVLAYNNLGNTLRDLGQIEEAIERYRQAIQIRPQYVNAHIHLGDALTKVEQWQQAEEHLQLALKYQPQAPRALISLAELKVIQGDPQAALAYCQRCLAQEPHSRLALAVQSVAYGELNDQSALEDLVRHETLIQIRQPGLPQGYQDLVTFHQELIQAIQNHPTLLWERPPQSTRSGSQTGNLIEELEDPWPALRELILTQAHQKLQEFCPEPDHPFLGDLPQQLRLSDLWAVVISTEGYQAPHIHPSAWISGVYYVAIPETITPEDPQRQGWIEFGRAPDRFRCQTTPKTRQICPEAGQMILFPSYLYHRTIPLVGNHDRISIAFDLVKVD